MRGTAYAFGDEINTDLITPMGREGDRIDHLFEPIRPDFAETIDDGDIIVAGEHFGSGSSRESAPAAIQTSGIAAVVAESFSRIYYRNSIAIGLPAITLPGVTDHVSEGDEVEVDLEGSVLRNHTTGEALPFDPLPEEVRAVFDAGGLVEHYRENPDGLRLE